MSLIHSTLAKLLSQDQHILSQLKQGDNSGINLLFETHFVPLSKLAFGMVKQSDLAKDLVQDVFVKLWQQKDTLQIRSSLSSYLKRSVINACIDYQRSAYARRTSMKEVSDDQMPAPFSSDTPTLARETQTSIDQAINKLPERCRLVFTLSRHAGLTYKQIAEELDISPKTVENQMSRALKMLRESLAHLLTNLAGLIYFFL